MEIKQLNKVEDYNNLVGVCTSHPLINVINFSKCKPLNFGAMNFGFYAIFIVGVECGVLKYGKSDYVYEKGALTFFSPGQVIELVNDVKKFQPKGYGLLFHPDLLAGTSSAALINQYPFFSYDVRQALSISPKETKTLLQCLKNIKKEINQESDNHSQGLIVSNIELFLGYCKRFYERQFSVADTTNIGFLEKFETMLNNYLLSDLLRVEGRPKVSYFAKALNLSTNYFGALVKKETGKTAKEYIHFKLMNLAKDRIFDRTKTISEIAYELGYKYPQHFNRMFKNITGISPNKFRSSH